MRRRLLALTGTTLMITTAAVTATSQPGSGQSDEVDPTVLTVDVSKPLKEVDHAASGSLYGIGDDGWPPDEWIAPTSPKMFTQPPPGATHLPNGEPEPVGDTLDVWETASRNGATVTVRLPDIFPTFPYQWEGEEYWYTQVEQMVTAVRDSGADNIYGYEIWNEPQWTWDEEWGDYFEMWDRTYRLIRELDPDADIIGPSYDRDYENGLREFMEHAAAADTVPDIVSWHELGPVEGLNVEEHVEFYRGLESELGLDPRPISINEYASPRDAGVPGWLTRYVARMERAGVDTANLAFWHKPGRLSDLLAPAGGGSGPTTDPRPTGNYWLFDWYGSMTGHMVETTPPTNTGRHIEIGEPEPLPSDRTAGRDGFGNALGLGGDHNNAYAELPDGIAADLDDFTIATWVNLRTDSQWARVWDLGTGTDANMFLTANDGDGPRFDLNVGGTTRTVESPDGGLPTGEWVHLAVAKTGDTAVMYIDGEPVASNEDMTLSPADLGPTTRNWIGESQYSADPLLNGTVDEFQIHDRGLTAAEIRSLLDSPAGDTGGGNVARYRFDEDGGTTAVDSSGNGRDATVVTATTGVERIPALEGFASADPETGTAKVVFGGGEGDIRLRVDGLHALPDFGRKANVQVYTTEWTGTDGASDGPVALFEGTYKVEHGSISVPVQGLNETDAYLAVVTPPVKAPDFADPVRRHEAEDAAAWWRWAEPDPFASQNRYVEQRRWNRDLMFIVDAPTAGAYDLGVRYTNPGEESASGTLEVNGREHELAFEPTDSGRPFATHTARAVLKEGKNRIRLDFDEVGIDYLEATPFSERYEAEDGEWTGADLVEVDMSEGNFFAAYFSGSAYVRGLDSPDSALTLPVTVPAAGTYELTIGYSTAGDEEERRAQTAAGHLLRVDDGQWQEVDYAPTQFREMVGLTKVTVELPAGASTLTFTKADRPGTVDLDYIDVEAAQ
ncbi:LamG-like jellyroll fold domain-containing protein [Glycomyces xiaoerkulensis]|uniref:LamG-like jellyroll fold domain-containing protein n=1 Tax=Glycomyces xiaoerkulensis TaxID=2038139 RepID=UPI000C25EAF2|nr:LamG-like jellyroll fold domain-containing protein [Glycomyces xiaoerkulensis]